MRYLGIDYGSKKVGLALSDDAGTMGFPHSIVSNTPKLVSDMCAFLSKEKVGAVVIGESRNLAGGENPIAKDARLFGELLAEQSGVPVFFESEVFTSVEARRIPTEKKASLRMSRSGSRGLKQQKDIDASAAALILTSYLSRISHE